MEGIVIKSFNLAVETEYIDFLKYVLPFINLIESAYKERFWGTKVYLKKIKKRDLIIHLAFDSKVEDGLPIGTVFLKSKGKLAGIAVIPKNRGKGIATYMIRHIMAIYNHLYVEIAIDNNIMINLLTKLKFVKINSQAGLNKLLNYEVITILESKDDCIIYYHGKKKEDLHLFRKFILFEFKGTNFKNMDLEKYYL